MRALLEAIKDDPALKQPLIKAATEAEEQIVKPLFEFRNWGQQLPHHWSTISDEAAFGTDYFTRTAVAKSNILVNAPNETKYYFQESRRDGRAAQRRQLLHRHLREGSDAAGQWLLVADALQRAPFFAPNEIKRYSTGTKNKALKYSADGSLTIYVQADAPPTAQRDNWLPAPTDGDYTLYVRTYWPKTAVIDGSWTPPPVQMVNVR